MSVHRRLILVASLLVSSSAFAQGGPQAMPVSVSAPIAKRVTQWDEYSGRFEAVATVEIRARVSGFIDKLHFKDGQSVNVGDPLFTIDKRPYEIAVESAAADVARNKAQVDLADLQVQRGAALVASRNIPEAENDTRKSTLAVNKAQLKAAEAALRNAELNLEWTLVRAPIGGRISDRKVDAGNLVSAGQAGASLLTTIVSLNPIHFVFNIPEPDYVRYARPAGGPRASGDRVQIRLANEKEWTRNGEMNFIDNQLYGKSGTIRARAVLENPDLFLTPGIFGRLRLFAGEAEALLIPDAAVVSDQSRKVVYAVGPDNKIQAKPVTLGPIEETLRVITSGLSRDDRVVISGLANPAVRSGAVVAPLPGSIVLATK